MSDGFLFDPLRYGTGKEPRVRREAIPATTVNRGAWHLVLHAGGRPFPLAHRLQYKVTTVSVDGKARITPWAVGMRWEGGWLTRCGVVGAALDLPSGPVQVCPKCSQTT